MPTTCMFCLRTGGMLNKPLLSLTRARSRPALRRFERHVSTLSLMIEQPPPPDKRIVRPPCRVSPDCAWNTAQYHHSMPQASRR